MYLQKNKFKTKKECEAENIPIQYYDLTPNKTFWFINNNKDKKDWLTPSEIQLLGLLHSFQLEDGYTVNITSSYLQRYFVQVISESRINSMLDKLKSNQYLIQVCGEYWRINNEKLYEDAIKPLAIIESGGYVNEKNRPKERDFNKNTSTDIKNLKQDNLSQESNINISIETKVSQIKEKQPLIETKDITIKQEENIQDITLNIPTEEINDEIVSTDTDYLKQEELSQESNISTQEEVNVAVIEEKEDNSIKVNFKDYVIKFIETEDDLKEFNILIKDIKFDYPTALIKKTYYEIKNKYNNSNEKLNRLVNLIDLMIKYFKLDDYFNDNNFADDSIEYILNNNNNSTAPVVIKNNQIAYTETETIETINTEENSGKTIYDEIIIPKNVSIDIPFEVKEYENEELKPFHTTNENENNFIKKLYRKISTESLFNYYFTMNLIKKQNKSIDDDYLFSKINIKKIYLVSDRIDLYYYIDNMLLLNKSNEELISIYNRQLKLLKNNK